MHRTMTDRYTPRLTPWMLAPDDETGHGADPADEGETEETTGGDSTRTFTQAEVDRMVGGRATKAEKAARTKLLEELGVSDPAEAKKILEAARKAAEKDKTELDKARDQATTAAQTAAEARAEAAQARRERAIDRALVQADVSPKRLDRMAKLVAIELDPDADDMAEAIAAAVAAVKDDMPEAFASSSEPKPAGKAPSSDGKPPVGGKAPARGGTSKDPLSRGAELARAHQGRSTTSA
jgi:hypothetical protein